MTLWGEVDGAKNFDLYHRTGLREAPWGVLLSLHTRQSRTFLPLAAFEYQVGRPSPQTFSVQDVVRSSGMDFTTLVLQINSNWASEDTCLYRVRVHGDPSPV